MHTVKLVYTHTINYVIGGMSTYFTKNATVEGSFSMVERTFKGTRLNDIYIGLCQDILFPGPIEYGEVHNALARFITTWPNTRKQPDFFVLMTTSPYIICSSASQTLVLVRDHATYNCKILFFIILIILVSGTLDVRHA